MRRKLTLSSQMLLQWGVPVASYFWISVCIYSPDRYDSRRSVLKPLYLAAKLFACDAGLSHRLHTAILLWRIPLVLGVSCMPFTHSVGYLLTGSHSFRNNFTAMTALGLVMETVLRLAGPLFFPFFLMFCKCSLVVVAFFMTELSQAVTACLQGLSSTCPPHS